MINIYNFNNAKDLELFFINYLHIKEIYNIYMSNFEKSHHKYYSFNEFVKDIYNSKNIRTFFSGAFTWCNTEQGYCFWEKQHFDFVNYIRTSEILENYWED